MNEAQPSSKKFIIERTEQSNTIHPIGVRPDRNSGFKVEAVTRPKQCQICRTKNKITRLSSNQWKCTECGHTWE